jgi:hypothetical protein
LERDDERFYWIEPRNLQHQFGYAKIGANQAQVDRLQADLSALAGTVALRKMLCTPCMLQTNVARSAAAHDQSERNQTAL